MDTEKESESTSFLLALDSPHWDAVLAGISAAENWIRAAAPGDPRANKVVSKLVTLADHNKWEIRRAVANTAAQVVHPAFESALRKLARDDNARVRQAAEHAALRRRDWRHASTLGKQHEERINSVLDDIEVRFGVRGREAVKRAGEEIANTFARELYHEVIKLITPLAMSADRLRDQLSDESVTRAMLLGEASRIERRINQLRAVLDAMRAYTSQPLLTFTVERLVEVFEEAAALAFEGNSTIATPIEIRADGSLTAEISRPRLTQALTNLLINAVESYEPGHFPKPIVVKCEANDGRIAISIEDQGCGMSEEVLSDARTLFSSSKENGTGFGLPLAIKIVESEHRGQLTLNSVRKKGTTVRLFIPAHRQDQA